MAVAYKELSAELRETPRRAPCLSPTVMDHDELLLMAIYIYILAATLIVRNCVFVVCNRWSPKVNENRLAQVTKLSSIN